MRLLLTGGTINPLSDYYGAALTEIGHDFFVAYPGAEPPDLSGYDCLLLTGGADIHPSRFGKKLLPNGSERLDLPRDELEFALFASFAALGKPILGICRGMQVINVALGGTLIQDLPSQRGVRHSSPEGQPPLFHDVVWTDGRRGRVNSYHHQAVDILGAGLEVFAASPDGTVEAVMHDTLPVFAVQWHPERMDGAISVLFDALGRH